ncbi:hypothetical protein V8C40DRAFT_186959 [Trichoderma camerunense]
MTICCGGLLPRQMETGSGRSGGREYLVERPQMALRLRYRVLIFAIKAHFQNRQNPRFSQIFGPSAPRTTTSGKFSVRLSIVPGWQLPRPARTSIIPSSALPLRSVSKAALNEANWPWRTSSPSNAGG